MTVKPISERVEVPGVSPATFKLVERGPESFYLYRSSRKIGTARVEPNGEFTARVDEPGGRWVARADSASGLLKLIGTYLLVGEAREAAAKPVEEINPDFRIKGKKTTEQRLSIEFARRAQKRRIAELDDLLEQLSKSVKRAPKG